ncbi:hypothetical protein CRT60_16490 [Azospirillum palustre]|uniref:Uncharacterized protein n=1 Tax=Azospirillum palustre TaxID=2044885 RepID=A0A2B8BFH3_9PROT|nr:hypothetical protein [Azospirillum palustre]PGH56520.1 hypothetical protein CRT60_16490 [Azospirillum palustre]
MNGKDLERKLSVLVPRTHTQLDHFGRALRAAGLLPLGGRGLAAPEITPQHVANMLIALAVAEKPGDAPNAVIGYAAMPVAECDAAADIDAVADTFGEALLEILNPSAAGPEVLSVRICRSWPLAIIETKQGEYSYGYATNETAREAGFQTWGAREEFRYGAGVLSQIAFELAGGNSRRGGWVNGETDPVSRFRASRRAAEAANSDLEG